MIEIKGAKAVFFDDEMNPVGEVDAPIRLEGQGLVTLIVTAPATPALEKATSFQLYISLPVLFGKECAHVVLTSSVRRIGGRE